MSRKPREISISNGGWSLWAALSGSERRLVAHDELPAAARAAATAGGMLVTHGPDGRGRRVTDPDASAAEALAALRGGAGTVIDAVRADFALRRPDGTVITTCLRRYPGRVAIRGALINGVYEPEGDTRRALADLAESASRLIMVDDTDAADDAAAADRIVQVMICREDGVTPVLTGSSVVRTGAVAAWTMTRVLTV